MKNHSPQCRTIGGGPGHDRCICYCHTTEGTTVTVTKDQLVTAILTTDDPIVGSARWHDAVFDDLLTRTGHTHATAASSESQAIPAIDRERLARAIMAAKWYSSDEIEDAVHAASVIAAEYDRLALLQPGEPT